MFYSVAFSSVKITKVILKIETMKMKRKNMMKTLNTVLMIIINVLVSFIISIVNSVCFSEVDSQKYFILKNTRNTDHLFNHQVAASEHSIVKKSKKHTNMIKFFKFKIDDY